MYMRDTFMCWPRPAEKWLLVVPMMLRFSDTRLEDKFDPIELILVSIETR